MKLTDYTQLINHRTEYFNMAEFYKDNSDGRPKKKEIHKGIFVEESAGKDGQWFVSEIIYPNSCFSVYKEYGPKGIIRCKWAVFRNGGAAVGSKYYFGPAGQLEKEEDMERHFHFTPAQVIRYCEDNQIDIITNPYNYIERYSDDNTGEYVYIIHYKGEYQARSGSIALILNGKDGTVERVLLQQPGSRTEVLFERN